MRDRHNIVGSEVGSTRPLIYGRPSVKISVPVRRGGWIKLILAVVVIGGLIAAAVAFAPSLT